MMTTTKKIETKIDSVGYDDESDENDANDENDVDKEEDNDNRELKQTQRRRKRERHLKMWLRVSSTIFQLFKLLML